MPEIGWNEVVGAHPLGQPYGHKRTYHQRGRRGRYDSCCCCPAFATILMIVVGLVILSGWLLSDGLQSILAE
jgi:hypothetical protein